jgi:hypothetical protein
LLPKFEKLLIETFVVSVGEITLKWGWLNGVNRQKGKQHGMAAERLFVHSDYSATDLAR